MVEVLMMQRLVHPRRTERYRSWRSYEREIRERRHGRSVYGGQPQPVAEVECTRRRPVMQIRHGRGPYFRIRLAEIRLLQPGSVLECIPEMQLGQQSEEVTIRCHPGHSDW